MRSRSRGQSTVEYALAISVLAIATVAAAWPFSHALQCGMADYSSRFETFWSDPSPGGGGLQYQDMNGGQMYDQADDGVNTGIACP